MGGLSEGNETGEQGRWEGKQAVSCAFLEEVMCCFISQQRRGPKCSNLEVPGDLARQKAGVGEV